MITGEHTESRMDCAKKPIKKRKSAVVVGFLIQPLLIAKAINGELGVIMGIENRSGVIEIQQYHEKFVIEYKFKLNQQILKIKQIGKQIQLNIEISKEYGYVFFINTGLTEFNDPEIYRNHIDSMLIMSKMEKKFFNHFERVKDIGFCIREIVIALESNNFDFALISLLLRSDFYEMDFKSGLSFKEKLQEKIASLSLKKNAKENKHYQSTIELLTINR